MEQVRTLDATTPVGLANGDEVMTNGDPQLGEQALFSNSSGGTELMRVLRNDTGMRLLDARSTDASRQPTLEMAPRVLMKGEGATSRMAVLEREVRKHEEGATIPVRTRN